MREGSPLVSHCWAIWCTRWPKIALSKGERDQIDFLAELAREFSALDLVEEFITT